MYTIAGVSFSYALYFSMLTVDIAKNNISGSNASHMCLSLLILFYELSFGDNGASHHRHDLSLRVRESSQLSFSNVFQCPDDH